MKTSKKFVFSFIFIIGCAVLLIAMKFQFKDADKSVYKIKANTKIVEEDKSNPFHDEEFLDQYFYDLKPTDKVLKLPGGGYLNGEAEVYDSKGNLISTYNSETDPRAKTVEETKKELLKKGETND